MRRLHRERGGSPLRQRRPMVRRTGSRFGFPLGASARRSVKLMDMAGAAPIIHAH